MVAVVRRQVVRVVLACTHVMAVLGLVLVEVFPLQTLLILVVRAARASGRPLAQLTAQAVCPVLRALLVPHPLPVGCLGKVAVAVVHIMQAQAVLAVLAVAALVVEAVAQHAVHMPQVLAA